MSESQTEPQRLAQDAADRVRFEEEAIVSGQRCTGSSAIVIHHGMGIVVVHRDALHIGHGELGEAIERLQL